jgi:hypothetical protein
MCIKLGRELSSKLDIFQGISLSKGQYLSMLENYKEVLLTTRVEAVNRDTVRSGLKKATKIFGNLLQMVVTQNALSANNPDQSVDASFNMSVDQSIQEESKTDRKKDPAKERAIRCIRAYVCFTMVANTYNDGCSFINNLKTKASSIVEDFMGRYAKREDSKDAW